MSIIYNNNQFHLKTINTSYIFNILDNKYPVHMYWGKALADDVDLNYFNNTEVYSRANAFHAPIDKESTRFFGDLLLEFSVLYGGDYRNPTAQVLFDDDCPVTRLEYFGYKIIDGKAKLCGLPAVYVENDGEAQTLEVEFIDKLTSFRVVLCYTVLEQYDVITRNIRYENAGDKSIKLLSAQSSTVDFFGTDYKLLTLHGDWLRERNIEYTNIGHNTIVADSKRGASSHMKNPFVVLMDKFACEEFGNVYGFCLVYSGSFCAMAEGSSCGTTRVNIGINPNGFQWDLKAGEVFQTPEVVMVYSDCGLQKMSLIYHKVFRQRLCRGKYRDLPRPLVINNWEGTGYNFNEQKIEEIVKVGSELGLETFVLDDGWFGKRDDDKSSLGDWYVNKDKLPNGLDGVAKIANKYGMKFGLWVEPEMISPNSNLYKNHKDWHICVDGRETVLNRWQYVLDLSNRDVCDYIIEQITNVISSANIEYIKWDCNRNIMEIINPEQQHRYMLGLYYILETLVNRFPNVLWESCSGGGGRFDAGMLYYMPQTWTSDETNAISRLSIQYGTSLAYPPISMTAHVGKIEVGFDKKNNYMNTCAMVAMAANFGFESDLTLLSEVEIKQAKGYVELYKKIRNTVQFGEFYRLNSPFEGKRVAWQFVDDDRIVLFYYQMQSEANGEQWQIRLKGLCDHTQYVMDGHKYSASELMNFGFRIALNKYEYASGVFIFERI